MYSNRPRKPAKVIDRSFDINHDMTSKKQYAIGFGMVAPKGEGGKIVYDTGAPRRRRKGEKRPVEVDYMELPIPKNASRARVHKMVDDWLDDRARSFKGASLGLSPVKRRRKL